MFIKIILILIAIGSGFTALRGLIPENSIVQIYYTLNSLIFVICLGFIGILPVKSKERKTDKTESIFTRNFDVPSRDDRY